MIIIFIIFQYLTFFQFIFDKEINFFLKNLSPKQRKLETMLTLIQIHNQFKWFGHNYKLIDTTDFGEKRVAIIFIQ